MPPNPTSDSGFLGEEAFIRQLHLEQRRTERSQRPFIFVLLESGSLLKTSQKEGVCFQILGVLLNSFRETDVRGWYEHGAAIGVIFTEIDSTDARSISDALVAKIRSLLAGKLTAQQVSQIHLSVYVFPEDWDKLSDSARGVLYPPLAKSQRS